MKSLKGTKTERNLLTAFAGESQARNRYTYYAKQAKKEGYVQISNIFEETADHETQHAKRIFKLLQGGQVEISAAFPAGVIGSTAENLRASAEGEKHEWSEMYPEFADVAEEEGFHDIAEILRSIAKAEAMHETRYLALLRNIQGDMVFKKPSAVKWKCNNCGYLHEGSEAPTECPACAHPQAHFEVFIEKW